VKHRVGNRPNLIYSVGTQFVALKWVQGTNGKTVHLAGAVGVFVRAPMRVQALISVPAHQKMPRPAFSGAGALKQELSNREHFSMTILPSGKHSWMPAN
jgi:hypothetical protein